MGVDIGDFLVGVFAPGIIIKALEKQDPGKLAVHCANLTDELLDGEFGDKKSEKIQNTLIPFVIEFTKAYTKQLREDQE